MLVCYSVRGYSFVHIVAFIGNYNWNNGGIHNVGMNGNWWSSTVTNATNARNLNFNASNVNPQNNNNKGNGFAVRCVSQ